MWGGHAWRAREARAYNGVWGRVPRAPAGSRAEPLVMGSGSKAPPPEDENLLAFAAQRKQQIFFILQARNHMTAPNTLLPSITHQICINLRNNLWQKWGGHVHPSSPCGDALHTSHAHFTRC